MSRIFRGFALLPTRAARASFPVQEIIPDGSFFAREREAGDIDGDGGNDIAAIRKDETRAEVLKAHKRARSALVTFIGTSLAAGKRLQG